MAKTLVRRVGTRIAVSMLMTCGAASTFAQTSTSDSVVGPDEPSGMLPEINERLTHKDSVFARSAITSWHEGTTHWKKALYENTGLNLAFATTTVAQHISDSLPDKDNEGVATTADLIGIWEVLHRGKPTVGRFVAHPQARWEYGTTGPENLGFANMGSTIGTADTFSQYSPVTILRNLYWRQGGPEAGWVYQMGKITPDAIVNSSPYLASETTFLPSGATGPFAIALPDSGIGASAAWFVSDRMVLAALTSDANGDRFGSGDIGEFDMFTAVEAQYKIAPRTENAPYSKLTLWYTNGTSDGEAVNAVNGPAGWGYYVTHQQELTDDGRAIGVIRYGQSFDDAAAYEKQLGVHFLLKNPDFFTPLHNDLLGVAVNWAEATPRGTRDETNFEVFYRFPVFPLVDTTFSYQYVKDPGLDLGVDDSHVYSFRIRTTF